MKMVLMSHPNDTLQQALEQHLEALKAGEVVWGAAQQRPGLQHGPGSWAAGRSRPLESTYPYLVVDAHYEYVREDGQVESDGVRLVKDERADGYGEILSVLVAPTEEEATWSSVFADLLARGLDAQAVACITSDEHKGLRKAMRRYLPKASWQRCQMHYQRNAAGKSLP